MSNYNRLYVEGGVYFFTLVTYQRKPLLCEKHILARLKAAFRYTIKKYPFRIIGLVILPDHLHCIWQLPNNDYNFSIRWKRIKYYLSIGMQGEISNHRREKAIWQRRFWEHLIRDEDDLQRCLDYIHYNPVKHGLVEKPCDWQHSTFRHLVQKGYYDIDWGSIEPAGMKELHFE